MSGTLETKPLALAILKFYSRKLPKKWYLECTF